MAKDIAADDIAAQTCAQGPAQGPARGGARDARRQAILEIAREVFRKEGYAAASMSAIAARAGGSKGTLYNYFPSKEALFAAFMEAECGIESAAALDILEGEPEIAKALKATGVRLLGFLLSDAALTIHRLVAAEAERFPELGRAFYEAGPKVHLARFADVLQHAMDEGRLRSADPARAADHFISLCKGEIYRDRLWNVAPEPTDAQVKAQVDAAVEVFMAAYGPLPGRTG